MSTTRLVAYTDGSCLSDGRCGAAVVIYRGEQVLAEFSRQVCDSTAQRMEILALLSALKAVPRGQPLRIISDSKYAVNGISTWMDRWHDNGWKKADKKVPEHLDLWQQIHELKRHWRPGDLQVLWTAGHAGQPGNERANCLAQRAAEGRCVSWKANAPK